MVENQLQKLEMIKQHQVLNNKMNGGSEVLPLSFEQRRGSLFKGKEKEEFEDETMVCAEG